MNMILITLRVDDFPPFLLLFLPTRDLKVTIVTIIMEYLPFLALANIYSYPKLYTLILDLKVKV